MMRFVLPALASLSLGAVLHAGESTNAAPPAVSIPAATTPAPAAGTPAADAPVAAPDATITQWVLALRRNDLALLYHALTPQLRAQLDKLWLQSATSPDADGDRQLNGGLGLLLAPNAIDLLVAQAEPELASLNPQDLVVGLQTAGGFLALAGSQPKEVKAGDPPALDYAALQGFLADIGTWIPSAGLNDPGKLRKAVTQLVAGAQALGVKNAVDVRALKIEEALHRLSAALPALKQALVVYGLDANALLDSVTVTVTGADGGGGGGGGDQRQLAIGFTAFGHPHLIPVKMVRNNDAWSLAEGKDSPFAPISQLLMMAFMMNAAGSDRLAPAPGGQPKTAPAPAPAPARAPTSAPL